mgnify:CR=1 FL=1
MYYFFFEREILKLNTLIIFRKMKQNDNTSENEFKTFTSGLVLQWNDHFLLTVKKEIKLKFDNNKHSSFIYSEDFLVDEYIYIIHIDNLFIFDLNGNQVNLEIDLCAHNINGIVQLNNKIFIVSCGKIQILERQNIFCV